MRPRTQTGYFSTSKKFKKVAFREIKSQAKECKKSDENFIRSLSLLYSGGIIGKVTYQQSRSASGMRHTGGISQRNKYIPIPRPLSYSTLMHKNKAIDVGEIFSVRDTLCSPLPNDNGVYRDLEVMLISLNQFYFDTERFRKNDQLDWFSEKEGSFKEATGGDGAP